jgi:branched-chain amino acid transport system ATP-binding protein
LGRRKLDAEAKALAMLEVRGVSAGYGRLEILHRIDLSLHDGEWLALLGSVGAGKTTLLRTIAGSLLATRGEILYRGEDITAMPTHERVRRGISMVPEGRRLFAGMTVRENLMVGAFTVRDRRAIQEQLARVFALFSILADRRNQVVGTLSGGEQQMCAIGRALMSRPRLMLVDELSLGLAPVVVERLMRTLEDIRQAGTTLLIVEQDVRLSLARADRGAVLRQGGVVRCGDATELLTDPDLRKFYLGY